MDNNYSDFMTLWNELMQKTEPAVWWGLLAALITFILLLRWNIKCRPFDGIGKKIEKARLAGDVVIGKRIRCRYKDRSEKAGADRMYIATYQYTLKGVTKTKQITSTSGEPPYTISIYFEKSGNKIYTEYDSGKNPLVAMIYIVPIIVAYFVMMALGFEVK